MERSPTGEIYSVAADGERFPIPGQVEIDADFERLTGDIATSISKGRRIVVVQGLGFVGTAVAAVIAGARDASGNPIYHVIGTDLPNAAGYWKVARLNGGISPFSSPDPALPDLIRTAVIAEKNLSATVSEKAYSFADIIVVDVPLDVLDRTVQSPREIAVGLDNFQAAIRTVGRFMKPDALVVIETTVPVGTSERVVLPILQHERLTRGIDDPLYLAHAYERVMPGPHYVNSIRSFWRSFAGIDQASAAKAREFLATLIDTDSYPLWELEHTNSSELAKLLENSYRAVNIAFMYEWTLLAEQLGINLFEVVDSIRVRKGTHDNMRFPGFGVGGYCLTKDSLLTQWALTNLFNSDLVLDMTLQGLRINYAMPLHTLELLTELAGGSVHHKKIAVLGVSYLPEVPDTRNSPTETLVEALCNAGAVVTVHDPIVRHWPERPHEAISNDLSALIRDADGIVLAVPHRVYRQLKPEQFTVNRPQPPFVVDAQNIISDAKAHLLHQAGCRLVGVGKGHWRRKGYQCQP